MLAFLAKALASLRRAYREGRLVRMIIRKLRWPLINPAAYVWRRLMFRTTFIAVTGSVGKTTFKDALVRILEQHYATLGTRGTNNALENRGLALTILQVRPWHRFAVLEIGIDRPGEMRKASRLAKPDIAVFLNVARCHTNNFKTLEAIAAEKALLLHSLGRSGQAVVNQDNPYVVAAAADLPCEVVRFGCDESADVRLLAAESRWPRRLHMAVASKGSTFKIDTSLVGTHWTPSILGALATAEACGVPLQWAGPAVEGIEPVWGRMQPVTLPSGATFLRDEWNASIDTFEPAFEVLREAEAKRKIVVFSDYSDARNKDRQRAAYLGRAAAELADAAVFFGHNAERSVKAAVADGMAAGNAHAFDSVSQSIEFLRGYLKDGDLVLLKGRTSQHVGRLYLGLLGPVTCGLLHCPLMRLCDQCPSLGFKWTPELKGYLAPPGSYV